MRAKDLKNALKGREGTQPEWPAAVAATGEVPAAGGDVRTVGETVLTGALRVEDPWQDSEPGSGTGSGTGDGRSTADAPDPAEVTVQLDRVAGRSPDQSAPHGAGGRDGGSDGPVFVDESGRRSRRFRRIGMAVALTCAVYAVVIVVTLASGNSNAPWLPVPGQADDPPASTVDTSPTPSDPARPPGTDGSGALPGSAPTAAAVVRPTPGATAGAPRVSAGPTEPGASPVPRPSVTGTPKTPGTGATVPAVETSPPPVSPSPDPSPSAGGGEPSPGPSPSQVSGGSGTGGPGTLADGPISPTPVAQEPGPSAPGSTASEPPAPEESGSPTPAAGDTAPAGSGASLTVQVV
ncbi:translation initiation factor IF-2 [Streptomyces sp. NPDC005526]|uniref:translation initiation factor IF-2 n=1 Tax=Streptomyces sp. NPDC005526 TaxID=3156885 RepID=UPI0033BE691D